MLKKILLFTATYNEFPNIKILLNKINALKVPLDILIIDDNSNDGTLPFLIKIYKKQKNIKLIIREKKLGLDTAHKIAFEYARNKKYNYLITMDSDLSHEPKVIKNFVKLLNKKTFIIGSRYTKGGKSDLKGLRFLMSFLGNFFIKHLLHIKSNEFTTSFRAFDLDKLKNLNIKKIKSKGYSFFMETIFLINSLNVNIYEIPIHFKSRLSGVSKISKIEIIRTLFNVIRLKFFYKKNS
jgi:glycosyltransferase involved in cell wall biosynthesis